MGYAQDIKWTQLAIGYEYTIYCISYLRHCFSCDKWLLRCQTTDKIFYYISSFTPHGEFEWRKGLLFFTTCPFNEYIIYIWLHGPHYSRERTSNDFGLYVFVEHKTYCIHIISACTQHISSIEKTCGKLENVTSRETTMDCWLLSVTADVWLWRLPA